ncbi:hypothetical protein FHU30_008155 [Actinomadura rupiterrae]|nr:hypothetical protein [Actinomadura rupiterrae]
MLQLSGWGDWDGIVTQWSRAGFRSDQNSCAAGRQGASGLVGRASAATRSA